MSKGFVGGVHGFVVVPPPPPVVPPPPPVVIPVAPVAVTTPQFAVKIPDVPEKTIEGFAIVVPTAVTIKGVYVSVALLAPIVTPLWMI
jgi:hypothetical protein